MKAVILAAGKGTRLGQITKEMPKPMIPVAGRPVLEHVIGQMRRAGIPDIVLVTKYLAEQVEDYFGDGSRFGVNVIYVRQPGEKYGTGAALECTRDAVDGDTVLMTFADVMTTWDTYRGVADALTDAAASGALNWVEDPYQGAAVITDEDGSRIVRVIEKPPKGDVPSHWGNSGIFGFTPVIWEYLERLKPSPRGEYEITDAFNSMIADGLPVRPFYIKGPWLDVGRPEDILAADTLALEMAGADE